MDYRSCEYNKLQLLALELAYPAYWWDSLFGSNYHLKKEQDGRDTVIAPLGSAHRIASILLMMGADSVWTRRSVLEFPPSLIVSLYAARRNVWKHGIMLVSLLFH